MTARDVLAEIEERADKATDGPWITFDTSSPDSDLNDGLPHILMPESMRSRLSWNEIGYVSEDYPDDAEFIAHARTDVPALVAALRAVLDLHRPIRVEGMDVCWTDGLNTQWPCKTVSAITEALGADA